jgi:glucoamylase
VWRRYNGDGYGEHDDGAPYDGTGRGRPWPLLTGERGHYELVAGRDPLPYLEAMSRSASRLGLIPEQVWDGPPIPDRELDFGKPTGSARPLAWAHAEFAKLVVSRQLGYPVDRPDAVWRRYQGRRPALTRAFWFPHAAVGELPAGVRLVVALPQAAHVRWSADDGRAEVAAATVDTELGFHAAELETDGVAPGRQIRVSWTPKDGAEAGGGFAIAVGAKESTP